MDSYIGYGVFVVYPTSNHSSCHFWLDMEFVDFFFLLLGCIMSIWFMYSVDTLVIHSLDKQDVSLQRTAWKIFVCYAPFCHLGKNQRIFGYWYIYSNARDLVDIIVDFIKGSFMYC